MKFTPRTAQFRTAHFTTPQLRTAAPRTYEPPDPYRDELMQREEPARKPITYPPPCPCDDKSYRPGNGSAPNGYAIAIERQKGHGR